ncbi:MAG: hypothetical protein K6G45_00300 [Lachnospiraceae bacterium]|nr:hypothetical protein [Lachnospiraceae bacterium]
MIVDNNEVIQKRYNVVSILVPLICVLLTYCGCLLKGYGNITETIPQLAFTACFGFILVFFIDIKRKTALDSLYKTVMIIACPGICFFVPSVLDKVGMTLIWILVISLFCVFLGIESSLIMTIGASLYLWAFMPELLDSEIVIYITSVFMICVITAFCDKVSKLVYASATFTVFYIILNCILRRSDSEGLLNMTVFSMWLFGLAMIISMFFIRRVHEDADTSVNKPEIIDHPDTDIVISRETVHKEEKTKEKERTEKESPETETKTDKGNEPEIAKEGGTGTYVNESVHGSENGSADENVTSAPEKVNNYPSKREYDQNYNRKKGSKKKHGKKNNRNYTDKTKEEPQTAENKTAIEIQSAGQPEITSELQYVEQNEAIFELKSTGQPEVTPETEAAKTGIAPETHAVQTDAAAEPQAQDNNEEEVKTSEQPRENKNQALYDSIQELSTRLMKLESENSLLQLMLNASVYDLATISDPDYTYIVKLREESPKNYQHCMKVARISADAADLINCDSEEAYAIGMYIKAPKLLGDGAASMLATTYKVPKNIISAVDKINNKVSATVMSREAGIVMLTDDILNTIYYLKAKNNDEVSIERIVNNTIKVRKEQNFLRSAGFSNEEIQLLRLYYIDIGGAYDFADAEGK